MACHGGRLLVLVGSLLVLGYGCINREPSPIPASPVPLVATFLAHDYGFNGPDSLPAGMTVIRILNQGQEPHHIQLVKLIQGKGPADLMAALQDSFIQFPPWAKQMGGPNGVSAGGQADATVYLDPGSYVLICVIPSSQGQPHVVLGMQKALQVIDGSRSAPTFAGDYHLAMADFEFAIPHAMMAGRHTFYVKNRGSQPHEVSVVQLNPGASAEDVLASFTPGTANSLPGKLVGGISGLEPGGEGLFTVTLPPGRYGMICLFPNPHSHLSHAAKGMVMNFTLQ
jgi:uncharacterized cupredoxin-like copper-binding protein